MDSTSLNSSSAVSMRDMALANDPNTFKLKPTKGRAIKPHRWIWHDMIHEGEFHLFTGESGIGKTQLLMRIAADITRGRSFPTCYSPTQAGKVLFLSSEDDWELTLLERFDACGGDREKLIEVPAHKPNGEQFNLHRDLDHLEKLIVEAGDVRLLIVDPVMSFVDGGFRNDEVTSVRELIHRIQGVGRRTNCATIGLNHLNKNDHVRAKSRINGSAAWEQAPRIVLGAREHPEYGLMLGKIKANIASMQGIYRYEQKHMELDGKEVAYVDWVEEANEHWRFEKFVSYMGTGTDSGPTNTATQQIADALQESLNDGQWYVAKPILDDLVELYGVSEKTVQRAAGTLGVERRRKDKLHGAAEWRLPIT